MAIFTNVTSFNTFAPQRLFLRKNLLENASNLSHEFLYDNFNTNILLNFLLKLSNRNSCVKFRAISRINGSFFSQKRGARSESVKLIKLHKKVFI